MSKATNKAQGLFWWESRPAKTGIWNLIGGYDVIVRERGTGRPVTLARVSAESERALTTKVDAMLGKFTSLWTKKTARGKEQSLAIAAEMARRSGWSAT